MCFSAGLVDGYDQFYSDDMTVEGREASWLFALFYTDRALSKRYLDLHQFIELGVCSIEVYAKTIENCIDITNKQYKNNTKKNEASKL